LDIICFIDNSEAKKKSLFLGKQIESPSFILDIDFDFVFIASANWFLDMYSQLCRDLRIPYEKIIILDSSLFIKKL
jgi:hypothetical protein